MFRRRLALPLLALPLLALPLASPLRASADSADYQIRLQTDVQEGTPLGLIVINVTSAWAPLGSAHLQRLVEDQFYNGAAFFRVVPNFVVQFGIAGEPAENKKWSTPIKDDPVNALSLIHI